MSRFDKELAALTQIAKTVQTFMEKEDGPVLTESEMGTLVELFTTANQLVLTLTDVGSNEAEARGEDTDVETWAGIVVSEINVLNGGEPMDMWDEWTWKDDPR